MSPGKGMHSYTITHPLSNIKQWAAFFQIVAHFVLKQKQKHLTSESVWEVVPLLEHFLLNREPQPTSGKPGRTHKFINARWQPFQPKRAALHKLRRSQISHIRGACVTPPAKHPTAASQRFKR